METTHDYQAAMAAELLKLNPRSEVLRLYLADLSLRAEIALLKDATPATGTDSQSAATRSRSSRVGGLLSTLSTFRRRAASLARAS